MLSVSFIFPLFSSLRYHCVLFAVNITSAAVASSSLYPPPLAVRLPPLIRLLPSLHSGCARVFLRGPMNAAAFMDFLRCTRILYVYIRRRTVARFIR